MTADLLMLSALALGWAYVLRPPLTWGQIAYRLYLKSPGWLLTKALRKRDTCQQCGSRQRLELHHEAYDWHNRWRVVRWFVPNLYDPMKTLCRTHHGKAHGKG